MKILRFLLIAIIISVGWTFIFGKCNCQRNSSEQNSLKKELFGGSDWNTAFWGVQSWNGWPY